jgi:peptidoglycan/LPS O-acetylase OafA/YrhL
MYFWLRRQQCGSNFQQIMLPRNPRYQSLDLWRGIACLAVVLVHSTAIFRLYCPHNGSTFIRLTSFGGIGVPLFFVISGYCISATADATLIKNQSVKTYFARRVRRIYPPYWIAIIFGVLAFLIAEFIFRTRIFSGEPAPQRGPWCLAPSQWFGNLTLTETWRPQFFGDNRGLFIQQAWTLCYEEQFYFVVGMLLLCARHRFFQGVVVITAAVLLVRIAVPAVAESGCFFDGQWFTFAAGVIAYYAINYWTRRSALIASWFLIAVGMLGLGFSWWIPLRITVAMFLAALLLILHPMDAWICRRKGLYPFSICGKMCYSLYLAHELVVTAISRVAFDAGLRDATATALIVVPLCVVASLGCGWLFYIGIEKRFLNVQRTMPAPAERRFSIMPTLPVGQAGCIAQSAVRTN